MPLPDDPKTPWPPAELKDVFRSYEVYSAWYAGDPDELARLYGGAAAAASGHTNRPSQFAGGLVGTLARFWWGQPSPGGERSTKLHVPLAGDIAAKSADLLYSEPPTFTFDEGNTKATERLEELVEDGLYATLIEGAELAAAMAGVYYRIVWDRAFRDLPWITAVHPDAAVPEWRWGQLHAVTFWDVISRDDKGSEVIRHLERHERGQILHAVYSGTDHTIGDRLPLTSQDATAVYAVTDDEGEVVNNDIGVIRTGVDALTAEYVPNIRPARQWRNTPAAAPLGRSDYSGLEQLFDALDEAWSSWMRDLRLAKARIFVPDKYLQNLGAGKGAAWSAEQEVFVAINLMPSTDGRPQIEANQFDIRVEEHEQTTRALMSQIVTSAGYSAQSFGLTGEVAVTATEVSARERQSYITRDRKIVYQRAPLSRLVETLLAIEQVGFDSGVEPERPRLDFADGVSDSLETLARTLQLLEAARAASTRTKVALLHDDWTPEEIDDEVQRIQDEDGATTADPVEFLDGIATGGTGQPAAPGPEREVAGA